MTLHPVFGAGRLSVGDVWEMAGCAPLVVAGDQLEAVRARLAERAAGAEEPRRAA
jgi:hypothetical protein